MATKKAKAAPPRSPSAPSNWGSIHSTFSGPSTMAPDRAAAAAMPDASSQLLATQSVGAELGTSAVPFNPDKAAEHGLSAGRAPPTGAT